MCVLSRSISVSDTILFLNFGLSYVNKGRNLFACTATSEKNAAHPIVWLWRAPGVRVLFALGEVRMHAWPALPCLTVVFSRCHRLAVPCRGDGIMCSGAEPSGEKSRAAAPLLSPPPPGHATPALPRHLIVRKVSAGPLRARRIRRLAKCRARLKGTVSLGPGSFFPVSLRLCLIMRAEGTKKKKAELHPCPPKVGVYRAEMSSAGVFRCSWRRSPGSVVTNEVFRKGQFSFQRCQKMCYFYSWLHFKATKHLKRRRLAIRWINAL